MALKEYMKKRHMSGSKSGLCDADGNMLEGTTEKSEPKKKNVEKKMAKKEKKRAYLDV